MMQLPGGGAFQTADAEAMDAAVKETLRSAADLSDLDIDADGTGRVAIAIRAQVAEGEHPELPDMEPQDVAVFVGGEEGGEGPEAGVLIALDGWEEIELQEEVRQKLESSARDLAQRLQAQLAEQEAAGGGAMPREEDLDNALAITDQAATLRVAVRSVNERFTELLAARLSAPEAETFQRKVLEASYARVYRTTKAQKAFTAAAELPGLDPDVLAGIAAIAAVYETDLDMANERLRRTIRKHQPAEPRHMVEQMASMAAAGGHIVLEPPDDPIREAFKSRRDLDERYLKQLDGFLTEEQRAALDL